ncbi:MAG: transposase [Alphaproteobacteria bacterium]|nr:transposase [Alphaproteobacteria bacterium]
MATESTNGPAGALGKQPRGRPVSEDLRGRAVAAVLEGGMSAAAAARHFGLGERTVRGWVKRFRERGHVRPDPMGGSISRIEPERERIFRLLEARPGLSVRGLSRALAAEGLVFHAATVHRFLRRHGLERDRRLGRHLARSRRKRWTER